MMTAVSGSMAPKIDVRIGPMSIKKVYGVIKVS